MKNRYRLVNDCIVDDDNGQVIDKWNIVCEVLNFKENVLDKQLKKIVDLNNLLEDCYMGDDKIFLKDSSKGDSRTSGGSPTLEEVLEAVLIHKEDVCKGMMFFSQKLLDMGDVHDWTKLDNFDDEYGYLVCNDVSGDDFLGSDWWNKHLVLERHHVNSYAHLDVNLLDVLEFIVDRVVAEKGRTGRVNVNYCVLDPLILVRAYYNTIRLLDDVTVSEFDERCLD